MKPVKFLPEAEEELIEAAKYYESQASGLGIDFLNMVERTVDYIKEAPERWPYIEGKNKKVRKHLVRKFPFGVFYSNELDEIVVHAIAHLHRKPGYWKKRKVN